MDEMFFFFGEFGEENRRVIIGNKRGERIGISLTRFRIFRNLSNTFSN